MIKQFKMKSFSDPIISTCSSALFYVTVVDLEDTDKIIESFSPTSVGKCMFLTFSKI